MPGARTRLGPRKEKGEARSDRIGEDIETPGLHQNRRMADPGDAHLADVDSARRDGRRHGDALRPAGAALASGPAVEEAGGVYCERRPRPVFRIEEAAAVEMVGGRAAIVDPVEQGRDDARREAEGDCEEEEGGAEPRQEPPHPSRLNAARG